MPDRKSQPAVLAFPTLSLPEFEETLLPNGIRLLTLDSGEEKVSRMTLLWNVGVTDVGPQAAYGLMTNLLTEGCDGLSGNEVTDILESNGAWFKATPSRHSTLLTLHSLNHTAPVVFPLLGKIVSSPVFPCDILESLKKKNAAEKQLSLLKPSYQATLLARQTLYGDGHPSGRDVTPAEILSVKREEIVNLHHDTLMANKPTIFLSGCLTDELSSLAKEMISSIHFDETASGRIIRQVVPPPHFTVREVVRKDMPDSLQTGIRIQIPTIPRDHPDYESLRFAIVALGGYFGSRLMTNIREEKGYTYGIGANIAPFLERPEVVISCECDNRYTEDVVKEIWSEINRLASEKMPHEELETVRNIMISNLAGILDSPFSISSFRETTESAGLPADTYSKQFSQAASISAEKIRDAAAKYLVDTPAVTALAGGKPG